MLPYEVILKQDEAKQYNFQISFDPNTANGHTKKYPQKT